MTPLVPDPDGQPSPVQRWSISILPQKGEGAEDAGRCPEGHGALAGGGGRRKLGFASPLGPCKLEH